MSGTPADNLRWLGLPANVRTTPGHSEEIRVRFRNSTCYDSDLLWINPASRPVRYAKIGPYGYIDIKTYKGHPWVFRESDSGADQWAIVSQSTERLNVFWPPGNGNRNVVTRIEVMIVSDVPTLQDICVRAVGLQIKIDPRVIHSLPIPRALLVEVRDFLLRLIRYRQLVSPGQLISNQHVNGSNRAAPEAGHLA